MKNLSLFILILSLSLPVFSQDENDKKIEKNQVNFYATDIINGLYTFSYERAVGKHAFVYLGLGYKTEEGLVVLSGIHRAQLKTNDLTTQVSKLRQSLDII